MNRAMVAPPAAFGRPKQRATPAPPFAAAGCQ
jgi:hypothetical protein